MNAAKMIVWDVQHGNAIYLRTPNGKNVVFDLGIGDYSGRNQQFSPLLQLRQHYGVQQIDYLVLTHPHLDHIDDILRIDNFYLQILSTPRHITDAQVMAGVRYEDKPKFQKYCDLRSRYSAPVLPYTDVTPANYGGVQFTQFLTPTLPTDNFNNHSIVTVVRFAATKIVLPGDNECASLSRLMERQDFREEVKNADILLAPHHGRKSAFHSEFVSLVNPYLTIVSDGRFCDTSYNSQYSQKSRGWSVWKDGIATTRYCLTTNSDGEVYIDFGYQSAYTNPYMQVSLM